MTTAIIGAGLAGLACARLLAGSGHAVRVFDKGRGPGGRMATRRAEADGRSFQFDHGAQYVTVRGPAFAAAMADAPKAAWPDAERWVGTPGMSALPRFLAAGLEVTYGSEIQAIGGRPGAWTLEPATGPFQAIVLALPPVQAARLLATAAPALATTLARVEMAPCWTAMAAFAAPLPLPDTLRPDHGAIGWAARDSAKPGRDAGSECWVIQATPAWSRAHLEATPAVAAAALLAALEAAAGAALPPCRHLAGHRWRYAAVEVPLGAACIWDASLRIGLVGDWCIGARAEAAFESGAALAATIHA